MTYWNDTQIQIIWNENRKQRQKQEIIDHPNDFKVIYKPINNILFQTQVESKISIFQKKNIKKRTFKITFIYSLYLETIQYLCRFHMLKVPPWKVPLRLYSSHVFTAMCLQLVYSWKFEAPWRFVDWEYSEYAATRSWSGTVTTGWIGMERLDMVSAEYPFRSDLVTAPDAVL